MTSASSPGSQFPGARLWAALVLVLGLGGCGGNAAPPDIAKIVVAVAAAVSATRKTKAQSSLRQFVERRVVYLTGKNAGWKTESGYTSLNARIGAEMDQVAAFVDERVAALGADTVVPGHRDLVDAAKRMTSSGPSTIASQTSKYRQARSDRIREVAWRACAVHADLWSGGDATLAPTLVKAPLTEALDRRLHEVECLLLNDEGEVGAWKLAGADAGWTDEQRTAMFEYPWVDLSGPFKAALSNGGLSVAGLAPAWRLVDYENRIYWNAEMNRVRPSAHADWALLPDNYGLALTSSPASAAFEKLFPIAPQTDAAFEDFWQRSWIYCDIMLAALHVHALRFGRARRMQDADASFDAAAAAGVTLRPLIPKVGMPDARVLMANGPSWFDGVSILHDELQVGDHLVYWNSPFVRYVLSSAFGLENSLVTHIAGDGRAALLAGHGMPETDEITFSEEMASEIRNNFGLLRGVVNQQVAADATVTSFAHKLAVLEFALVKWAPFGEAFGPSPSAGLSAGGAWWIRLKREQIRDSGDPVPSMPEALAAIPKSVRYDPARHTQTPPIAAGDHDAQYQESVYLPLSTPAVRGGWGAYLAAPSPGAAVALDDLIPDGSMVPGFFANGPASTVPVLRPKLTP